MIRTRLVILFGLLGALGCSSGSKNENLPLSANYCHREFGAECRAMITFRVKEGSKTGMRFPYGFQCECIGTDQKSTELKRLDEILSKTRELKNSANEELLKLTREAKEIVDGYLTDRCPGGWKVNIQMKPLGWRCTSDEFPIDRACAGRRYRVENEGTQKSDLACLYSKQEDLHVRR